MNLAERRVAIPAAVGPGSLVGGRYVLERLVGSGGMGSVWLGRHVILDRPVAVKLIGEQGSTSALVRSRFANEARVCAKIRSHHVVQIHDCGVDDEVPYIVMEALEGNDLGALHRAKPNWPLAEVANVVTQVARGLSEAHAQGVVHRDIKLSNLFLARTPDGPLVKILDFGIARRLDADGAAVTSADVVLGTPSYMTPEQLLGLPIDGRVDVWALAVVAFRLLTGKPCFRGDLAHEVTSRILSGERELAATIVDGLPRELDALFATAFASDLGDRFQSAAAFAEALAIVAAAHPGAVGMPRRAAPPALADEAPHSPDAGRPTTVSGRVEPTRRLRAMTWVEARARPEVPAPRRQSATYLRAAR